MQKRYFRYRADKLLGCMAEVGNVLGSVADLAVCTPKALFVDTSDPRRVALGDLETNDAGRLDGEVGGVCHDGSIQEDGEMRYTEGLRWRTKLI